MGRSRSAEEEEALHRAQDLIYDAWEAPTAKQSLALARKALKISPLCADAYALLAESSRHASDKALTLWRQGVAAGEAALGEAAFKDWVGEFWGVLETRPYMRARCGLARCLWARGEREEAAAHLRDMLYLCPNDNLGLRYLLAAVLVEMERDEELAFLLDAHPESDSAAWPWTMALAAFRRGGDHQESRRRLAEALAANPHVPAFLLGLRPLLPDTGCFTPGEEDDAAYYAEDFRLGWAYTKGARDWLRRCTQLPEEPKRTRKPPIKRSAD